MELLKRIALGCLPGALALLAGCQTGQRRSDVETQASRMSAEIPTEAGESSAALMAHIGDQPYVTADAGYRAVYALWKGESFAGSFDEVADALRQAHIIGRSWNHDSARRLTRARVGYMVCRATRIRTGLNWQVTGLGRYAWRELIYRRIAAPSSEHNFISGGEFLGVISRADEYASKGGKAPPPNLDLGPRPD